MPMFDGGGLRPISAARNSVIVAEVATEKWQLRAYNDLRRRVFVSEQGLFEESDEDQADSAALPIVAMTLSHGMPDQVVGTVRIFPTSSEAASERGVNLPREAETWYGGRLAVDSAYRRHGQVGEALIRSAVCTAHALGCTRFLATVQLPVVRYFERRHFQWCAGTVVCGVPHALMQADLSYFPPKYHGTRQGGPHREAA